MSQQTMKKIFEPPSDGKITSERRADLSTDPPCEALESGLTRFKNVR